MTVNSITNSTVSNSTKKNVSVDQYGNEYSYGDIRNALNYKNSTPTLVERDIKEMNSIIIITTVLCILTFVGFGLFFVIRFYKKRMLEVEAAEEANRGEKDHKKHLSLFSQNNAPEITVPT